MYALATLSANQFVLLPLQDPKVRVLFKKIGEFRKCWEEERASWDTFESSGSFSWDDNEACYEQVDESDGSGLAAPPPKPTPEPVAHAEPPLNALKEAAASPTPIKPLASSPSLESLANQFAKLDLGIEMSSQQQKNLCELLSQIEMMEASKSETQQSIDRF